MKDLSRRDFIRLSRGVTQYSMLGLGVSGCIPKVTDSGDLILNLARGYSGIEFSLPMELEVKSNFSWIVQTIANSWPDIITDIEIGLWVMDVFGYLYGGGKLRYAQSNEVSRMIRQWTESDDFRGEIAYGLRPMFLLSVYESMEVKKIVGYEQPWVTRSRVDGAWRG